MARQVPSTVLTIGLLVAVAVGAGLVLAAVGPAPPTDAPTRDTPDEDALADLTTFDSRADFRAYVDHGHQTVRSSVTVRGAPEPNLARAPTAADGGGDGAGAGSQDGGGPARVGRTNVQVASLDEPDRVKTDGRAFYYAPSLGPDIRRDSRPNTGDDRPVERPSQTHVIDASEPADPQPIAAINHSGRLLRTGDRLLVFGDERLAGYDVSDPANPEQVWTTPLEDRLVTAREQNGTVYLVTRTPVGDDPCPVEPLGSDAGISCTDVYHPRSSIPADSTYTAFALDADDGAVRDSVSFVGTGRNSLVYMAPDALYVSYTEPSDRGELRANFLLSDFERTPATVESRIRQVRSYDLSPESTHREIRRAVRSWLRSLAADERRAIEQSLSDGFQAYLAENQRTLTRTGIVRVRVDGHALDVDETASVPGRPLNQFSMDERNGTLRIATTIPAAGDAESAADLYTLDAETLERLGSETGMGEGQRVYAVRYVGDTAYVITFRQVDPLHVVDLADPTSPTEVGTLELPGFSTYLHPVDDEHVLGVGEEDGQAKAVLFDVSDPSDPTVADAVLLDAGRSAVSDSHHAFTIDRTHGVAFLPAGGTGTVLDYTNETLSVERTVSTNGAAERARYVEDHLYVFAAGELAVVDETDWTMATRLDLPTA
jgi:uncharacterized secreted protein with C-terminal beta-propeller domain